jgi:integrase
VMAEVKATRPLRPDELRRVWLGADQHVTIAQARMIRLALLLGRRRSEIAQAEVAELRMDERT